MALVSVVTSIMFKLMCEQDVSETSLQDLISTRASQLQALGCYTLLAL